MKVLSLVNNQSGCCYHRTRLPITYLMNDRLIRGVPPGLSFEESVKECDILFFNRIPHGFHLNDILPLRKKYGFRIVVDLDDYWRLYPDHFLERIWQDQHIQGQLIYSISKADAVTCTTDRLRNKILLYNNNVHVVPSGLPFGDMQFIPDRAPGDRLRFIYAGGSSHFWDVRLLRPAMDRLSRETFTSDVVLAGVAPGVDIYRKMQNDMSARGRLKSFRTITYQPLESYMDLYFDGDVALAPLVCNEFNAHKSNLKVLEAGCKRMPIIASNVGPYRDDPCPHIMRVDTPSEWYKWIRWCEQNPAYVMEIGQSLHEWVVEHYSLRDMNSRRMEAFSSVL